MLNVVHRLSFFSICPYQADWPLLLLLNILWCEEMEIYVLHVIHRYSERIKDIPAISHAIRLLVDYTGDYAHNFRFYDVNTIVI